MMCAVAGEMEFLCVHESLKISQAHLELAGCGKVG
jgi:hypothetical protein